MCMNDCKTVLFYLRLTFLKLFLTDCSECFTLKNWSIKKYYSLKRDKTCGFQYKIYDLGMVSIVMAMKLYLKDLINLSNNKILMV